jgi:hypothetical protein
MVSFATIAILSLASTAKAQTVTVSGQYSTIDEGKYFLQNDEWGLANTDGQTPDWQNIGYLNYAANNNWWSEWQWPTGNGTLKAYPSIVRGWNYGTMSPDGGGFPCPVSWQAPLPTTVSFSMYGNNIYDTAYDLFFASTTNPSQPGAELMVWLQYSGTQPAGSKIRSAITMGNMPGTWDVWWGTGPGGWPVWSFVADQQTSSFSENLQPFIYYVSNWSGWLSTSWYELGIQFGTEIRQSNGGVGGINVSSYSADAWTLWD